MYVRCRRTDHIKIIFLLEHSSVAYIHIVEYSECFITDARMFWRSLWGSAVHVQAGISKQLVLTEGLFTDSRLQIAEFRIYILLHTFKWYRISAVTFFVKYVCKKTKHGMFKSILNLLCLKTIHENTKVLVKFGRAVLILRGGVFELKKRLRTTALGKCMQAQFNGGTRIEQYFLLLLLLLLFSMYFCIYLFFTCKISVSISFEK